MTQLNTISPKQLAALGDRGNIIDVRTPVEFREVHAESARNIPLDTLDPDGLQSEMSELAEQTLYVICKSGARGAKAQRRLMEAGCTNVINVEGGTDEWVAAGLPVVRGKKAMSLERQVRIAAGLIVLAGALLAMFVHPWFIGICAFVGAGLTFAGITDTCAMGLLIARMPWNRVNGNAPSCGI